MSKKGSLVIISGFSGAGKGTVVKELMKNYECYALSISATTRNPRPGEENGREYFFKTKEEFEELIRQDALYEYAQYVDNYYGTPKAYVEEQDVYKRQALSSTSSLTKTSDGVPSARSFPWASTITLEKHCATDVYKRQERYG